MGTRCLTVIVGKGNKEIAVLFRQFDGYPDGHGQELRDFLKGMVIGNGITGSPKIGEFANGMECLAAQIVAHFKTEPGEFYLLPAGTRGRGGEYIYTVVDAGGEPHVYEEEA